MNKNIIAIMFTFHDISITFLCSQVCSVEPVYNGPLGFSSGGFAQTDAGGRAA